jgi:hypothetical protein
MTVFPQNGSGNDLIPETDVRCQDRNGQDRHLRLLVVNLGLLPQIEIFLGGTNTEKETTLNGCGFHELFPEIFALLCSCAVVLIQAWSAAGPDLKHTGRPLDR